ncbi:lipoyl domain-containing protein [Arthrobacter sp. VKM Ac-2550]|uniref:lipoyl domain-containing protein n=1 Tax=Crystallibacter permensis TaxID=1938888 RepID=UPI002225F4D9|nr:lipoyl domain-containing protein [Arthrobacter sp. VKM Ac-2550]MCW2131235.1 Biotin-requiring enzyme [Arthrobacter sp. VKM Ac-2550]
MDIIVGQELLGAESEADLSEWLVEEGSEVAEGQAIAELETSKVQVEVVSPASGTLTYIAAEGDVVEPETIIARVN